MTAIPACIEGATKLWFVGLLQGLLLSCIPNCIIIWMKTILREFPWYETICGAACQGLLGVQLKIASGTWSMVPGFHSSSKILQRPATGFMVTSMYKLFENMSSPCFR